jgi:hypothetical protein
MWDFLKKATQTGLKLGKDYLSAMGLVESLLNDPFETQALARLEAKLATMDGQARTMFAIRLRTMLADEQQRLELLAAGVTDDEPQKDAAQVELRLQRLRRFLGSMKEVASQVPSEPEAVILEAEHLSTEPARQSPVGIVSAPLPLFEGGAPASVTSQTPPAAIGQTPTRRLCMACAQYRGVRPLSDLLATEVGTSDAAIISVLEKIREDEMQQFDAEAEAKARIQFGAEQKVGVWPDGRPRMHSYCGLREMEGVYLINEVKNPPPGLCLDYTPGSPPGRSCRTCTHRVNLGGRDDRAELATMVGAAMKIVGFGGNPGSVTGPIYDQTKLVGQKKGFEVLSAYFNSTANFLPSEPQYLSYCSKYSRPNAYAVCALWNPTDSCPEWQEAIVEPPKTDAVLMLKRDEHVFLNDYLFSITSHYKDWVNQRGQYFELSVSPPKRGGSFEYRADSLPNRKWIMLAASDGTPLLVSVFNEGKKIRIQLVAPSGAEKSLPLVKAKRYY